VSIVYTGLYTTVENVTLSIPDVGDRAHVTVEYDVEFSDTDQLTNQAYEQHFQLVGADASVGEGSPDDVLNLSVLLPYRVVRPNGEAQAHQAISFYVDWAELDEDLPLGQNPDEIKARVRLTPLTPHAVAGESAVVTKTIVA
jgi:hypothetical protein